MHPNAPLPYAIEYAKSARSTCKKCKKNINVNALRMSVNQPATFFDGNIDSWFHYTCFWQKLIRGRDAINISSIKGVDWLRWEDQESLRDQIQKFKEPQVAPVIMMNVLTLSALKSEKSATNRGKCVKCTGNFEKGEIKVLHRNKSLHFKCHLDEFDKIDGTLEDIPGWAEYDECWRGRATEIFAEVPDSKRVQKQQVPEDNSSGESSGSSVPAPEAEPQGRSSSVYVSDSTDFITDLPINLDDDPVELPSSIPSSSLWSKKRAANDVIKTDADGSEVIEENDAAKKRKLGRQAKMAELLKRRMKMQVDQLWECRQVFEKLSNSERSAVLRANDQDIPEGQDAGLQVVERLADNALFGTPIACQTCSNGKIVYSSSRRTYVCTGYVTEYSKCTFETKNPVRTPFVTTPRLDEKCKQENVAFNAMSERLYIGEEEEEEVVKIEKRKSKGGVRGDQFIYAAEAFDSMNRVPTKVDDITSSNTHIIKNGTVVDAKFQFANNSHVYKNENDGELYQATLSFTDLTLNKNSYYKIQLLKDDIRESYYVFRSWGRVGTEVGDSKYECYDKEDAIARFEEIFSEKTKNEWKYRKHFRKMPGAFNFVETDYSEFAHLSEQDIVPGSRTQLPKSVKEVVMSIFDVENMKSALKSFEMDVNKMPLGRLSRNQINQAFSVLTELSDLLIELPIKTDRVLDASNKFYTIIPHNFGMKVPEPIDSFHKVKEKNNMLNALLDIKFAYDQICGGENPTAGTIGLDPVDLNYRKLKCAMTPLERGCQDWNMIQEYLNNTQGSTHDMRVDLVDILKVERENESTKFKHQIGNRRLLWHGSGRMNYAGILGQGLRIAPPEAPASGYMFGKGVYFADMFSKSFFYCRANQSEEAYLLLCDVALGEMLTKMQATTVSKSTLPKGTHSVKGVGRECPNESGNFNHPDGYLVPKGPRHVQLQGKQSVDFSLLYNEYIVYDVDQIQLKYLVRVKMHYARHR